MCDRTSGNGVVKLSLNVPALERLLMGDQALEIELREQVKQQVFNNHLGNMLEVPTIKKMVDEFEAKIKGTFLAECQRQVGVVRNSFYQSEGIDLSSDFKMKLADVIRKNLEPFIRGMVEEHARRITGEWLAMAETTINKKFEEAIEKRINDGITQRLAAAAAAK